MFRKKKRESGIKKRILIGLGLAAITAENAERVARYYLKNKITKKEAKKIAKKALTELKKSKKIAKIVEGELRKNIERYIPKEKRRKIAKQAYKKGRKVAGKIIKKGIKKFRRYY